MPSPIQTPEPDPAIPQAAAHRDQIMLVVAAIPPGHVATYGQVAELAGLPRRARLVGHVLRGLPAQTTLPWHRVVAAGGRVAVRGGGEREQIARLKHEGVLFRPGTAAPRVDIAHCAWRPGT